MIHYFNYFRYMCFGRTDDDNSFLLNYSANSIIDTVTYKIGEKKLFPYFLSEYIKLDDFQNNIRVVLKHTTHTIPLTKTRFNQFIIGNQNNKLISYNTTDNNEYFFGKGIIKDNNNNTLLCVCVDLSRINFDRKEIPKNAFYLLLNSKLLFLPQNKKLLSIINSKDGIVQQFNQNEVDIIYTSNIDNKIFDVVDIAFTSIGDRKKYFQDKLNEISEDIEVKENTVVLKKEKLKKKIELADVDF